MVFENWLSVRAPLRWLAPRTDGTGAFETWLGVRAGPSVLVGAQLAITGSGGLVIVKPTMAASGGETFTGLGGMTIGEPALAAVGAWVLGTPIFTFTVAARTRALEAVQR